MKDQSAIEQFCVAIRAYYPEAIFRHIDTSKDIFYETPEIIRVTFRCKKPYEIIQNKQFGILIEAGLAHSLVSVWPAKYPDSFQLELNPHFGIVEVNPFVVGYPEWPRVNLLLKDGSLDRFLRLVYLSDVYTDATDD
jgi:hypothetical protein